MNHENQPSALPPQQTHDLKEELLLLADKADNFVAASVLPAPLGFRVAGLKSGMEEIAKQLRRFAAKPACPERPAPPPIDNDHVAEGCELFAPLPAGSTPTPTPKYEVDYDRDGALHWVARLRHGPYVSYHYVRNSAEQVCSMLNQLTASLSTEQRLREELVERRRVMADVVRVLGDGCCGLSHNEIAPKITALREELKDMQERYDSTLRQVELLDDRLQRKDPTPLIAPDL